MDVNFQILNGAGREAEERCSDDVTAPDWVISGGVKGQPEVLPAWFQGLKKKQTNKKYPNGCDASHPGIYVVFSCRDSFWSLSRWDRVLVGFTSEAAVPVRVDQVVFGRAKDGRD